MKLFYLASLFCTTILLLSSCNCEHNDEPAAPFKVGWVLCTDGEIMSFCDYVRSDRTAVAIVYYVNPDYNDPISGYAVYLQDTDNAPFCDTERSDQGTSADLNALDGNENTYALFSCENSKSPMSQGVFDLWTYGQSAYVPSVAQLRQLQKVKDFINPRIEGIGGDPLPDDADNCWYWSSTEVDGQKEEKAWLVSMHSGFIQETPKIQSHRARPVVTIYKYK